MFALNALRMTSLAGFLMNSGPSQSYVGRKIPIDGQMRQGFATRFLASRAPPLPLSLAGFYLSPPISLEGSKCRLFTETLSPGRRQLTVPALRKLRREIA